MEVIPTRIGIRIRIRIKARVGEVTRIIRAIRTMVRGITRIICITSSKQTTTREESRFGRSLSSYDDFPQHIYEGDEGHIPKPSSTAAKPIRPATKSRSTTQIPGGENRPNGHIVD